MTEECLSPLWASSPGNTIERLLNEQALDISGFAEAMSISLSGAKRLLEGKLPVSEELAGRLSEVVGGAPRFWLERERLFRIHQVKVSRRETSSDEWLSSLPLRDMKSLGWLPPSSRRIDVLADALEYFEVSNVEEWKARYVSALKATAFRKSESFENKLGAAISWLRRGEIEANAKPLPPWHREAFLDSLREARKLTRMKDPSEFLPKLENLCARAGVALVVARCPTGCTASGAARFLSPHKALLMLSFRFLSDDHFWFSLFHEAGHLLLHGDQTVVDFADSETTSQIEREANQFAEDWLIPNALESLRNVPKNKFAIARHAAAIGVSPGIVVGQMQHKGLLDKRRFNPLKVRYQWDS